MSSGVVRLPSDSPPLFVLFGRGGRAGPASTGRFTVGQIAEIRRTVRRVPEVMVKVTGGGRRLGAVVAHLSYISQDGQLELQTDEGLRVSRDAQKASLEDWHLELSAGQYRRPPDRHVRASGIKLVHNIVLSMPSPTSADKVLAAAKKFAREKFWQRHRYVMALHTHQQHPHVHLVVKAEDEFGQRLHIDKALLREWRQDFAQLMREQGVAANATPRAIRGQNKCAARDGAYRTQRRGTSSALRQRLGSIVQELSANGTVRDPARGKLLEIRKAVQSGWMGIAQRLDAQGEIELAGDVRDFARHLPPVRTDRERLAEDFVRHVRAMRARERREQLTRDRGIERSR